MELCFVDSGNDAVNNRNLFPEMTFILSCEIIKMVIALITVRPSGCVHVPFAIELVSGSFA